MDSGVLSKIMDSIGVLGGQQQKKAPAGGGEDVHSFFGNRLTPRSGLGGQDAAATKDLDLSSNDPLDYFGGDAGSPSFSPPGEEDDPEMSGRLMDLAKKYGPAALVSMFMLHGITKKSPKPPGMGAPAGSRSMPSATWNRQAVPVKTADYYTYGAGPGKAMYSGDSLPQVGAAQGGNPQEQYVKGPGSGRDDSIDAKLSDGEYVMDAETVSLLGDGSSDEGAKRLDELRENLRQHKGQTLAKGKFSPNAKRPEEYLGRLGELKKEVSSSKKAPPKAKGKGKPVAFDVEGQG